MSKAEPGITNNQQCALLSGGQLRTFASAKQNILSNSFVLGTAENIRPLCYALGARLGWGAEEYAIVDRELASVTAGTSRILKAARRLWTRYRHRCEGAINNEDEALFSWLQAEPKSTYSTPGSRTAVGSNASFGKSVAPIVRNMKQAASPAETSDNSPDNIFRLNTTLNRAAYRSLLSFQGKYRPLSISCETINICNYRCVMCAYPIMERPKAIMSMEIFKRVLEDYTEMGGGTFSLHPVMGDIFLDKKLPERIELLNEYELIGPTYFVTNGVYSDRFDDQTLKVILKHAHFRVSVYGLDRDEHSEITEVDDYDRFVASLRRLIRLKMEIGRKEVTQLSITLKKPRSKDEVAQWMEDNLDPDMLSSVKWGVQPPLSNFGGGVAEDPLTELGLNMTKRRSNSTSCFKNLNPRVLSNGDVTACPCADYDGDPGLHLGNIGSQTLLEMYNSEKLTNLLGAMSRESLPEVCRECTFHTPISSLDFDRSLQRKFSFTVEKFGQRSGNAFDYFGTTE